MAFTTFCGKPADFNALKIKDLEMDGNAAEKSKSILAVLEKPLESADPLKRSSVLGFLACLR